jgi:hypothetical protein
MLGRWRAIVCAIADARIEIRAESMIVQGRPVSWQAGKIELCAAHSGNIKPKSAAEYPERNALGDVAAPEVRHGKRTDQWP